MRRGTAFIAIFLFCAALPLAAQAQQSAAPAPQQPSLGEIARKLREQQGNNARKPGAVFTNDNLPAPRSGDVIVVTPSPSADAPAKDQPAAKDAAKTTGDTADHPKEADKSAEGKAPEDKVKTRDYWQAKFKSARQDLARAKEQEQLSEDELNLLQIQQIREIDPQAKTDLTAKVQAKQTDVDVNVAATQAAQKRLDELEKEFKDSGAPEEWGQTDKS